MKKKIKKYNFFKKTFKTPNKTGEVSLAQSQKR
jgi:hypothetical protein